MRRGQAAGHEKRRPRQMTSNILVVRSAFAHPLRHVVSGSL